MAFPAGTGAQVDPVLGRKGVEREQLVGDLGDGLVYVAGGTTWLESSSRGVEVGTSVGGWPRSRLSLRWPDCVANSTNRKAVMAVVRHVIENPVSGERIVIHETAADTGGALLAWELLL